MLGPANTTCLICQAPLQPLERSAGLCRRQSCRLTYQSLPKADLCRICRRPLAFPERRAGLCSRVACQHVAHQELARREREAGDQARDQTTQELYQLGVARRLVANPEAYPVVHLPSQQRPLGRLTKRRRQAFQAHLDRLIAEVQTEGWNRAPIMVTPQPSEGTDSGLAKVSGRACAGCKGHCCQIGDTHAWLTTGTIRRIQATMPGITPDEMRAMYQARLGQRTYLGSCVYHGPRGCHLPREIRSDQCNTHFCGELKGFRRAVPEGRPVRAFMVWRREKGEFSAAFVDAEKTRPVKPPANPA